LNAEGTDSRKRRIGHLGPPGTHGEEALRAVLGAGVAEVELVALESNADVVRAVESGEIDAGFAPIENSVEGAVTETLDALVHDAPAVRIAGEVVWPAHHCLIAAREIPLEKITVVTSHPQALSQCAKYLGRELPQARKLAAVSTAGAIDEAIARGGSVAGIGSAVAAELYGGVVLAERIEDEDGNKTRFVWLAKDSDSADLAAARAGQSGGAAKTSLVFAGFNDTSPGGLVSILSEFARRDVNMSKIESRPERTSLGHYLFFVDLDGSEDDPPIAAAIEGVRAKVRSLRVLGSYLAFEG
jgi:prephenate dehydratase